MVFDVASLEEALELAARIPAARDGWEGRGAAARRGRDPIGHIVCEQPEKPFQEGNHDEPPLTLQPLCQRLPGWLMAPITATIEIARPAAEVFAYVTDPSTMPDWQQGVLHGHLDGPTTRVGSRCTTIRRIGGREREVTTEITDYDPPRRWADRGIDGPIRARVEVAVKPLAASGSKVTISVEFHRPWHRKAPGSSACSPPSRR